MSQERFNYLLQRFKADALSDPEREEWQEIVASERYRSIIDSDIESLMGEAGPVTDPHWDTELERQTWEGIMKEAADGRATPARVRWIRPLIAAAACILLVFGIRKLVSKPSAVLAAETVTKAPRGGTTRVLLSDGTIVLLDAASTLRYPTSFGDKRREVALEGEAYFEVSPNSHVPFIVKAGGQEVEVLGTRFNISVYPADAEAYTTLLEGSVRVGNGPEKLLLKPGQEAVTSNGKPGLQLREADTTQILAWKNKIFSFKYSPLHEVKEQLERWYDVQIDCGPAADTLRVSGYISRRSALEDVLKMLAFTNNIYYSIEGKKVRLEVIPKH